MLPLHHSHHEVGGHAAKPRDLLDGIASDALAKRGRPDSNRRPLA
jgi:hypothetical protein